MRERRRMPRPQVDTGRAAYSMLLGLGALLLVGALSFRQLTAPSVAQQLMAEGIASLTEIDAVLAEYDREIDQLVASTPAGELIEVPGFPIDVRFTAEEHATLSESEFRDLLLARAASLVYDEGLGAFHERGASSISLFSTEGVLDRLVGTLSETNHRRAGAAAAVLAVLTAVAAVMVVVRSSGFTRVRALAVPLVLAAAAGLVATAAFSVLLGRWWGGDPFSDDIHAIISDGMGIGRRNYAILGLLGLGLLGAGIVFELLGRFVLPSEDDYVPPEPGSQG